MHPTTKKLGELLVEAGLITVVQLQEALRYQKAAGGRMGSNLVAMGIISEDSLMDFLARQTGVPRLDVKHLEILPEVLERIPRRLAEQMTILPVFFKEPKSLVVAMADPSDLNAVDSARFASGLTIEPMVASHSALRMAIADQYRKLEAGSLGVTVDVNWANKDEGLPVNFELPPISASSDKGSKDFPRDPFFDRGSHVVEAPSPFNFFNDAPPERKVRPMEPPARPMDSQGLIIPSRAAMVDQGKNIDALQTRTLVLGLVRLLQRRGILGPDELPRFINNLLESGELQDR